MSLYVGDDDQYVFHQLYDELFKPVADRPKVVDIPKELVTTGNTNELFAYAFRAGLKPHETENLLESKLRPVGAAEEKVFRALIESTLNNFMTNRGRGQPAKDVIYAYTEQMCAVEDNGLADKRLVDSRVWWQLAELIVFLDHVFGHCSVRLWVDPIQIPSGKYTDTMRYERTRQDLIAEMAQNLTNLAPYHAYAKVIDLSRGQQEVIKKQIQTLPIMRDIDCDLKAKK